jgi:hypothetical protein
MNPEQLGPRIRKWMSERRVSNLLEGSMKSCELSAELREGVPLMNELRVVKESRPAQGYFSEK